MDFSLLQPWSCFHCHKAKFLVLVYKRWFSTGLDMHKLLLCPEFEHLKFCWIWYIQCLLGRWVLQWWKCCICSHKSFLLSCSLCRECSDCAYRLNRHCHQSNLKLQLFQGSCCLQKQVRSLCHEVSASEFLSICLHEEIASQGWFVPIHHQRSLCLSRWIRFCN